MKKKNVGVIGCGKWGTKIINELKEISNIKFIYNSENNYKNNKTIIDWVFILTPNKNHYEMTKYFLERNINVFCEKPLTTKIKEAKYLISISNKLKVNLYINDIENYKKKKIKINNNLNTIIRKKKDTGTSKSLLYRLAYHDFYLLNKYITVKKIKSIETKTKKKVLKIKINLINKNIFNFVYDVGSDTKIHSINDTRMDKFNNNPIKDMLKSVLYKKNNFRKNSKNALNCIELIEEIKSNIK